MKATLSLLLLAVAVLPATAQRPAVGEEVLDQQGRVVQCSAPAMPPDHCFRSATEKKAFFFFIFNGRRNQQQNQPQQQPTDPAVLQALNSLQQNQSRMIELIAAMRGPAQTPAPQQAQPPLIVFVNPGGTVDPRYTPPVNADPRYVPPVSPDPRYTPPVNPDPRYTPPVSPDPRYLPPVTPDPRYVPPVRSDPYVPPVGPGLGNGKTTPSPGAGKQLAPDPGTPKGYQTYTRSRPGEARAVWTPRN